MSTETPLEQQEAASNENVPTNLERDQFGTTSGHVDLNAGSAPDPEPKQQEDTGLSDAVKREAMSSYGFQEGDLEGYDDAQLQGMMSQIDRRAMDMMRMQQYQQQQPQQPNMHPPFGGLQGGQPGLPVGQPQAAFPPMAPGMPQQPQMPMPQQQQQGMFDVRQMLKTMKDDQGQPINVDEYDPALLNAMNAMSAYHMQQMQQAMMQQHATAEDQYFNNWFDAKLGQLGEDYEPVFGKGDINQIAPMSQEWRARESLQNTYVQLEQMYPHLSGDELFARALRMEQPNVSTKAQKKQLSNQLKDRSKQTIGKPTGRKTKARMNQQEVNPEIGVAQGTVDAVQDYINKTIGA